ncbi:uncharacterized protein CBL_00162 [Carabus blaptoides fortunei]
MNAPVRSHVLKLYKELLRYGEQLQLTDKEYYVKRIKKEFIKNKELQDLADINYSYKKGLKLLEKRSIIYGPGGQAVNKTANCVVLKHKPTGITVKCHESRSLDQNRKIARTILTTKLDNLLNKEDSIESQTKKIQSKKIAEKTRRRNKLNELKEEWKK